MRTMRVVIGHELRLLARSRATPVVLLLLVVVFALAAWNGVRWTERQRWTLEQIAANDARAHEDIGHDLERLRLAGDPRPPLQLAGMAWYIYQPEGAIAPAPHIDPRRPEAASSEWVGARHAVLPPAPTAAFAIGQSDLYPFYTRVTIRTRPVLVHSDEIENPINLLSGRFDLAFALAFCWPLIAMPLLFNVLTEEHEGGTLALVASQPVPLRLVLLTRLAVRVGVPVAVTILSSVSTLAVAGGLPPAGAFPAVALWSGAVTATAVFWAAVAAAINLVCRRSATAATAFAAVWLAAVVITPAVIGELAAHSEPVPSRIELVNAVRLAGSLSPGELNALVNAYYEERPEVERTGASADETAIRGLAQQDEVDRRIDPVLLAYRAAAARQQVLVDRLRMISPPLVLYDSIVELAGTTSARYREFAAQVDRHHRAWRDYFYPLVHARTSMTPALYDAAPRFAFVDDGDRARARRSASLIVFAAVAGLGGLVWALARASRIAVASQGG